MAAKSERITCAGTMKVQVMDVAELYRRGHRWKPLLGRQRFVLRPFRACCDILRLRCTFSQPVA